jgi:Peptidase family C25
MKMANTVEKKTMQEVMGVVKSVLIAVCLVLPAISLADAPVTAAKVHTKESGFYRVSKAHLAAVFSMSESNVAVSAFHLKNMGRPVPSIRDNGDIVFFGHRFETTFTDENIYWIYAGSSDPIATQTVVPGTTPFLPHFPAVKMTQPQLTFRGDLIRTMGSENDDPIYWRLISSGLSTSNFNATITVDGVAPSTGGSLKVKVKGATDIAGRYYHRARIILNNTLLGEVSFEGLNNAEAAFSIPSGLLTPGNNTVKVQSNPPAGTTFDSFYLDFIEASYQRTFVAVSNFLFMPIGSGSVEVSSMNSSNIICWNVEDPWMPRQLVGGQIVQAGTNWKYSFTTSVTGKYAAVRVGAEFSPVRVSTGSVVNLKSTAWQLDHLTITEAGLFNAGQAIKTQRQNQGLLSEIIKIEDIFDSFNFGIRDPRGLQNFLAYAYRNWATSPRYIFLLGDGSLDYKNHLGAKDSGIPAFPMVVSAGMYASDYKYGDIDSDGMLEMAVGRLPVNAVSNVNDFIQKMINYENGGNWKTNALITTDQTDYAGNFYEDGNAIEQNIVDREVARADIDIIGATQTREKLIQEVNEGKEISVYIGHGTPNQLSLQSILLTADALSFTNSTAPSTFLMIGCLVGSFANPAFTNIGEGFMRSKGGAASFIAAATLISASDGKVLTEKFLDSVYTEGTARVGDSYIKGKNQLTITGRSPAFHAFQLLGDPGMAVSDVNAPRVDGDVGPSRGSFEEWKQWAFPPVLQDSGLITNGIDDPDGDQFNNWSEYMAGSDPLESGAFLEITDIRKLSNDKKSVSWPSAGGRSYRLEYATSIQGQYLLIQEQIPATQPLNTLTFDSFDDSHFYRVVVE